MWEGWLPHLSRLLPVYASQLSAHERAPHAWMTFFSLQCRGRMRHGQDFIVLLSSRFAAPPARKKISAIPPCSVYALCLLPDRGKPGVPGQCLLRLDSQPSAGKDPPELRRAVKTQRTKNWC